MLHVILSFIVSYLILYSKIVAYGVNQCFSIFLGTIFSHFQTKQRSVAQPIILCPTYFSMSKKVKQIFNDFILIKNFMVKPLPESVRSNAYTYDN